MLDPIAGTIERYMDLLTARQRLVASNIANADTPGYKTKDFDFATELNSVMGGTGTLVAPSVQEISGLAVKNDGNNVSLDREARMLAENAMRFSLASQIMRGELRTMRMAIQEGREG